MSHKNLIGIRMDAHAPEEVLAIYEGGAVVTMTLPPVADGVARPVIYADGQYQNTVCTLIYPLIPLLGASVEKIEHGRAAATTSSPVPDLDVVRFSCGDRCLQLKAVGDCCSASYIESFDDAEAAVGGTLRAIEVAIHPSYVDGGVTDGANDTVSPMTIKLFGERGWTSIDFRNYNNGSYFGYFEPVTDQALAGRPIDWTVLAAAPTPDHCQDPSMG